jgi:hypothetical protein
LFIVADIRGVIPLSSKIEKEVLLTANLFTEDKFSWKQAVRKERFLEFLLWGAKEHNPMKALQESSLSLVTIIVTPQKFLPLKPKLHPIPRCGKYATSRKLLDKVKKPWLISQHSYPLYLAQPLRGNRAQLRI